MGLGIRRRIHKIKRLYMLGKNNLEARSNAERTALILCHAIEKGMGVPDVKKGYGQEKAKDLLNLLEHVEEGVKSSYMYQESLAILSAYCDYQKQSGINISEIVDRVQKLLKDNNGFNNYTGGYQIVPIQTLQEGMKIDFPSFINSRHSMRMYSDNPIEKEQIIHAVDLAKRAPSACNRQPWKFYYSMNSKVNKQIMNAVPKQSFLEGIPYFGVITVDKELFSTQEVFQWFINGGIFAGYLQLAFHSIGIGSCLFQFAYLSEERITLKKDLEIPDNEEIIVIIGYGNYPTEAKCILAERRRTENIAIER